MLTDNAITYPQDRSAREWTFNYYTVNAELVLLQLAVNWKGIQERISKRRKYDKIKTLPMTRWVRYQDAFEVAIDYFEKALEAAPEPGPRKKKLVTP